MKYQYQEVLLVLESFHLIAYSYVKSVRHVSMEDYIRTAIPKADYDVAQKLADEYFKELKNKGIV